MSKKVVLFTTYLLEDQDGYLFDKDKTTFGMESFKSSAMLDYFLDDLQTLKSCSDYFAMMDWKRRLGDQLWRKNDFESPFWFDELKKTLSYYKNKKQWETIYNDYLEKLKPILILPFDRLVNEDIKQRIFDEGFPEYTECQRFADGDLNMYWGGRDAPNLPLLHRRFSVYVLNNENCPDYATYAVWSLRYNVNNDVHKWRDALIAEILERNSDCEEIILAIHDKDAGHSGLPFKVLEFKNKRNNVTYSVVLFDHANSWIHPLLRQPLSSNEVYEKISKLIK